MPEQPTNRRLAAILAADVVGYSKLMGADEAGTLSALKQHRDDVFEPSVAKHNGRTFKLIGDGTLVEFASVVDAVKCAMDIQSAIASEPVPDDGAPHIRLRIGVNLGDVILDGDDVYGDGVNIAARLEPLADHGGVCVSTIVRESVGSRIEIDFADGGDVHVKNIERPLRIWKWHPGSPGPAATGIAQTTSPADEPDDTQASIAVLPFDNMSRDPDQEYFSDGISEDIITDLSKVDGLMVIARNSSFAYKGKSMDLRTVGRELGVSSVLEGSIRRAGNRVRITAQLIDANDGGHLWAERFDRDLTDIFEVQDEVTRHIVDALKLTLTAASESEAHKPTAQNLKAHDIFLQARGILARTVKDRAELEATQKLLFEAIAIDPNHAEAHAGLAMTYNYDFQNRWTEDSANSIARAVESARKAVELAPASPYAHYTLAVATGVSGDFETSDSAAREVLRLNPNYSSAHILLGIADIRHGRKVEAIPHMEKAIRLDPSNNVATHFLGVAHLFAHNFETAAATFRHRVVLFPETDLSRVLLAATLGHLGEIEEARRIWTEIMDINPNYDLDAHMNTIFFVGENERTVREGLGKAGLP